MPRVERTLPDVEAWSRVVAALEPSLATTAAFRAEQTEDGYLVSMEETAAPVVDGFLADLPGLHLQTIRQVRLADIAAKVAGILLAGAPAPGGLHLALDDGSRADMTAMGTTAIAAASGALPWPESYALGWITVENVRIPLPAPADGLALVASAGSYYAQVVQHGRSLKDAILAALDEAAIAAIDIEAGWPVG